MFVVYLWRNQIIFQHGITTNILKFIVSPEFYFNVGEIFLRSS